MLSTLQGNVGLNGTFTPPCRTATLVSKTQVTICGCRAKSTPPTDEFPALGTPDVCLASGRARTLEKKILTFSLRIGEYEYTCNTDRNNNPYSDCLNSIAKICNPTDVTFDKSRCQSGVDKMVGQMNPWWRNVRIACGQWAWQGFIGSYTSSLCASANSNLTSNAYYTVEDGSRVQVTSKFTESIKMVLWSSTALRG